MYTVKLNRYRFLPDRTLGNMMLPGSDNPFCQTLEDTVRKDPNPATPQNEGKVYGETAIPAGTYKMILSYSPHFLKVMPEVLNVPGYSGIRIHSGNRPQDTLGCILVGMVMQTAGGEDIELTNSRDVWNDLMDELEQVKDQMQIVIT